MLFILFCVYGDFACVSVSLMRALPTEASVPWNWSLAIIWELGIKPGLSERTAGALNCWVTFQSPHSQFRITAPHYNLQMPVGFSFLLVSWR